ncbi:MAG TPA: GNAT family N-acetyltransferase [Sphingomonas sp.]|nr:GNAT family N-acetyltransferase [Sphingomonas sp.]
MIETDRLILRPWRETDKPAFHDIVNTPAMMEYFGGVAPRESIDALIDMQIAAQAADGCSMWAVDARDSGVLLGICGVRWQRGYVDLAVYGELEIGWRIAEAHWGRGIAREAAEASLAWAWTNTAAPRVAAWTSLPNNASWGLMKRLGMNRTPDLDFQHPRYPDDPLGAMIVYTIDRPASSREAAQKGA